MSVIYSASGINKRFGAVRALRDVHFNVVEGKVNGLVGANGAGKSTLLKIIAGAQAPDAGELTLDGRRLAMTSTTDAARAGIAMVSQELSLFPALSVEENLLLAPGGGSWNARRAFGRRARDILGKLGVAVSLKTPLHRVALADRQLVEIARTLLQNPRVLILDEPTSSLHAAEVERLHDIIRGLRDTGIGIVYVSHFLEELLEISDNLVILRNGRRVTEEIAPSVDNLKAVRRRHAGRNAGLRNGAGAARADADDGDKGIPRVEAGPLRISGLRGPTDLVIDDLQIEPGAVVGVAGLAGAGVEELFAVCSVSRSRNRERSRCRAAFPCRQAPPARQGRNRLHPGRSQALRAHAAAKHRRKRRQRARAHAQARRLRAEGRGAWQTRGRTMPPARRRGGVGRAACRRLVRRQSAKGGVRQMDRGGSLALVLDDPTRGIDIGAKREMHGIMHRLARSGRVVLFYSSDPGEIVAVSERVIVFVDGVLSRDLDGETLTEHALVTAMNTSSGPDLQPAA